MVLVIIQGAQSQQWMKWVVILPYGSGELKLCQSDVPEKWRTKALSEVDPASIDKVCIPRYRTFFSYVYIQRHSLPGCYYHDSDFCFLDDQTGPCSHCFYNIRHTKFPPEGDYFDLRLVPERYTGYSGKNPHRVWHSIYEENCFGPSEVGQIKGNSPALVPLPEESDPQCLEKRVYYKIISGIS